MESLPQVPRPTRAWLLAVIAAFALGAFVRLASLDDIPLGVQQDELSNVYDGYSILTTGADRFGDRMPVIVRGFGENDYRPALYPWLTALTQSVTGFSVAAGRLPSAVLGVLSLFLVFTVAQKFAGPQFALAALLFAALSPIHIVYSRLAHEGSVLPAFFVILVMFIWQKGLLEGFRPGLVAMMGFATGLSANSYQATKLIAFLLAVMILIDLARDARAKWPSLAIFSLTALIGALPQVVALIRQTDRFFARAKVLSVPADGPLDWLFQVARNYWINIEPVYLFWPGETFDLSVARLLTVEMPFFYVGLLGLWALRARATPQAKRFIYVALLITLLPAAVTEGNPNALRGSAFFILAPFVSAAGVVLIGSWIRNGNLRRAYYPAVLSLVALNGVSLVYLYATSSVYKEAYYQKVLIDAAKKLGPMESSVDRIIVERYGTQAYIYFASFSPMHPREFQNGPRSSYSTGMDEFTQLGKYRFVWPAQLDSAVTDAQSGTGRFLVLSPQRVPSLALVDSVAYGAEKLYIQGRPSVADSAAASRGQR